MIVALNNKSNLTKEEFISYQKDLVQIQTTNNLILCPSSIHLANCNLKNYQLGSQNVSKDEIGAHTGEITASQLKSYNVSYCIVGHSERRQELKETNEEVNEKIRLLLKEKITPILCIGETKEEREAGQVKTILETELQSATKELTESEIENIIIAYEPIWSIGTGIIPTIEEINEVMGFIKKYLPKSKILYGGSANENNIDELKKCSNIDGYLLGGLSLKPEKLKIFLKKLENDTH